jgi:large subunit ribosomal protein L3
MKRHHWRGQPKSHGSTTHRRVGSVGASAYPSRIIKGLRMPGHMGNAFKTAKKLKVLKIDNEKNILFIRGCVPGPVKSIVRIKKVS